MKRIAAFLVALLLVATCTVYVSAADITAVMTSADANVGDKVTLEVTLAGAPETNAMAFALVDLPQGITFVKKGSAWELEDSDIANFNVAAGQGAFAYGDGVDPNGLVLTLAFEIGEDVVCGENVINFEFYPSDSLKTPDAVTETAGVITIPHTWADELTNTDAEGHYYACEGGCGEKKDFEEHGFDMSCDETCDECGYTRTEVEHDFSETLVNDDPEGHYYECACGAKDGAAEHEYSYDCDATCNVCGFVREAADHQPVGEVVFDDEGHWGECACGEQIDKTAHEFEYECSTECMYCDYVREAEHDFSDMYNWDEEGHSRECMYGCGEKTDVGTHVFDQEIKDEWTIIESANCMHGDIYAKSCVCGYIDWGNTVTFEVGEPDEDAHNFYYDYETDTATCQNGCETVIGAEDGLKGEEVEKIEGNGATLTAPDGVLGENMTVEKEDLSEFYEDEDFGEVDEDYEGYEVVGYDMYYIQVGDAFAGVTEGMEITVKIPTGKFTDIQLYNGPEGNELFDYVDNGDGTITITVNDDMANNLGAVPVLFIGKPRAAAGGDNGLTALWIAVLAIAVVGVAATAFYSKKRRATK